MRFLIIRNAYSYDFGGAETYALNLAISLKRLGHKPIIVTKVSKLISLTDKQSISYIRAHWFDDQNWGKKYISALVTRTLWYCGLILFKRIDAVCPQSRDDFIFATIAAKLLRKRCIWTDHGDLKYILDAVNHPSRRLRWLVVYCAKLSDGIICVSNSERDEIAKVAPEILDKLIVIHNGVFDVVEKPIDKGSKFVIGTTSRLITAKGIAELITAFSKLIPSSKGNMELWLVGDGPERAKFEELSTNLGIEKNVKFIGYSDNALAYVAAMDIYVHSSYHEAFSLAILEATMLQRCIVATNVGGTPEIINSETGVLVKPKDVGSLVSALSLLYKDKKLRNSYADGARKYYEKYYNFEKIVSNSILPLYLGAIKQEE